MNASEWIAVPGAPGAAVVPTKDARHAEFDLDLPDGERRDADSGM
jgi:hypothetical protein